MSIPRLLTPAEIKDQLIDAAFGPIGLLIEKQAVSLSPKGIRTLIKLLNSIDLLDEGSIADRENSHERLENFFRKHQVEEGAAKALAKQIYVEAIVLGETERIKRHFPTHSMSSLQLAQVVGPLLNKGLSGADIQSYVNNNLEKAKYATEMNTAGATKLKDEYKSAYKEFAQLNDLFNKGTLPASQENRYQELIHSLQNYYKTWQEENFYPPYVRQTHLITWCNAKLAQIDKKTIAAKQGEDRALSALIGPQFLDRLIFNVDGRDYDAKQNEQAAQAGADFIKHLFAARQPMEDAHDEESQDEKQQAKADKPLNFHFTLIKQKTYEYLLGHASGSKPHLSALESLKIATHEFKTKWDEQFVALTDALKKPGAQPFDFWKSILQPHFFLLSNQLAGMKSVFFTQPLLPDWPFLARDNLIKLMVHFPAHMEKIIEATGENSGLMTRLLGEGNFTQLVADMKKEMDALEAQGVILQPETRTFYDRLQQQSVKIQAAEEQKLSNDQLIKKKKTPSLPQDDAEQSMRSLADNLAHALIEKSKQTPISDDKEQAYLRIAGRLRKNRYPTYKVLFADLQELKDQKIPTGEFRHTVYEHAKHAAAVIFKGAVDAKPIDAVVLRAKVIDYLVAVQEQWYAEAKDMKQAVPNEIEFLVTAIDKLQKSNRPVNQIIDYLLANFEKIKKGEKVESINQLKQLLEIAKPLEKPRSTVKAAEAQGIQPEAVFPQPPPATVTVAAPSLADVKATPAHEVKPKLPPMPRQVQLSPAKQQANELLKQIQQRHLVEADDANSPLVAGKKTYDQQFAQFAVAEVKDLGTYLAKVREAQLGTKSSVVTVDGLKIRVYPRREKNIDASVHDLFASGIDNSRGALAVLQHSNLDAKIQEKAETQLKKALTEYHQAMKVIADSKNDPVAKLKAAKQLNKNFNARLVDVVFESGAYPYQKSSNKRAEKEAIRKARKKALAGIQQARDLMWTLSHRGEAVCTVRGKKGEPVKALSLAKRMEFSEGSTDYKNETWFKQAEGNHPWTGRFYQHYPEALKLSPTPMQRDRPNLANAWRASTILFYNGVPQVHSRIRAGIPPPYMIEDDRERQRITNQNQKSFTSDELLTEYVLQHVDHWPDVLPKKGEAMTVPILHQTLIDPGSPRYYLSGRDGPEQMIKEKIIANQALREHLADKNVFFNKKNRTVSILPSGQQPPDAANCITINFSIKEVNNGINRAGRATIERWDDIQHSQDLIAMAVDKLDLVKLESDDLELVKGFLRRGDVSFNPRIKMGPQERSAMEAVCGSLFKGTFDPSMSLEAQRNLALLIQASCKLKGLVHESGGGNVRRRINRAFDAIGLSKTGRAITALGKMVGYLFERRGPTQKSCYERIVGELLGVTVGGCKSSVDRDGEIDEHTTGLYLKFAETGTIYNYFHPDNYPKYANTQHKHNMCEIMTGTAGTSDVENNGLLYRQETSLEQQESGLLHSSRKIKIDVSKNQPALDKTVVAEVAATTPVRGRSAEAPALGVAHEGKPPVGKPRSVSAPLPVKEQQPASADTVRPAATVANVDATAPTTKPPVVEKRLTSESMVNQLRLQSELNQVAKLVKNTEIKSTELKMLGDIHPNNKIYKINDGEGLIAVKKEHDILQLYVANVPQDRKELLKLAYATIAAFVSDQGPKAPIYVNPGLDPQLIAAFNAICQVNGLTAVPPGTAVIDDVPNQYKNLNIHLLREQNKTKLSVLGPWQEKTASHLEHAAVELAKAQPAVQTLQNTLSRLEEDHKMVVQVVNQFPQQGRFLAESETDDHRRQIESTIKMLQVRIAELEKPVQPISGENAPEPPSSPKMHM